MFELLLFSPLISPLGLILALWAYPWRKPVARPHLWVVLAMAAPLLCIIGLQAAFTLPAGSCVERPLNNVPLFLALASVIVSVALVVRAKAHRKFALGTALFFCPITLFWAMIAVMSLAGCWI